jgi:3-dehydroquinate dehydratase-2
MKILVIHGPNLNMLGRRDPAKYGNLTLADINKELEKMAKTLVCTLEIFQSNHEGAIINFLQKKSSRNADGILVNPGALIRYAYCFRQALVDNGKPVVEIHMSDINKTGVNKKVNILDDVRIDQVIGLKEESYFEGLRRLVDHIREKGTV